MTVETYTIGSLNYKAAPYGETLTRDRYRTPKSLRLRGLYLDLPYSKSTLASRSSRMEIRRLSDNFYQGYSFSPTMTLFDEGSDVPPNEADVISKLAEAWRGTDLSIGMYLSPEGRESVEMMANAILKVGNSALSLKRGDLGGFFRHLNHMPRGHKRVVTRKFNDGDLSGAFLSAHLGWTPLIKDAYEAANIQEPPETGKRISASKSGVAKQWRAQVSSYYGDVLPVQRGSKLRVKYIGDISRGPTFSDRFGLNNPFLIAWNVVPLSFVADYFLPIGSVLDSMGFISAARFSKLWRKTYRERWITANYSRSYRMWSSTGPCYGNGSVLRKETAFTRAPTSLNFASPLRSMKVSLPSSLMRLATISALTHQRIRNLR